MKSKIKLEIRSTPFLDKNRTTKKNLFSLKMISSQTSNNNKMKINFKKIRVSLTIYLIKIRQVLK